MQRHPVDPLSGALGLLTVALGVLVASGHLRDFHRSGAWWLLLAAVVIGLAIVPWRGHHETPVEDRADEPGGGLSE